MKLILANRQTDDFRAFYDDLQAGVNEPFDYSPYTSLLFSFNNEDQPALQCLNLDTGRNINDYSGVYINGYLATYELAATAALACQAAKTPFINQELSSPVSMSKLTMHAKLALAGVNSPAGIGGSQAAILRSPHAEKGFNKPMVLKRADADRGIDNFMVNSGEEVKNKLSDFEPSSLWILQDFIPNSGFYLISFYGGKPAFCIYRTLEERPDGKADKAHMYKPAGGRNASLVDLDKVPARLMAEAKRAAKALDRQIASVDCIYDEQNEAAYILEVNYNPQIVTIKTFKDIRTKAYQEFLDKDWLNLI